MFVRRYFRSVNPSPLLSEYNSYRSGYKGIKLCQESKLVNYSSNVQIKECLFQNYSIGTIYSKRYYSKKFIEELFHEQNSENEKKFSKDLFSNPRATLNELASKVPEKIFDIHFKQTIVAPKGIKKKPIQNDWICTYTFIWPEKMKFESAAISKRQAADKSATQALHWLYNNKRIDINGKPIYNENTLKELQSTLNNPLNASISENSLERITRIWEDYERDIKHIYERTFDEAKQALNVTTIHKDSTLDETDCSEDVSEQENIADELTDTRTNIHPVFGKPVKPTAQALARRERTLRHTFKNYDEQLTPLPIDEYSNDITSALDDSRVLVIIGAAGCGKSTRAPVAVLRQLCDKMNAIVSQPRRVAAIGLAQRVSDELGEKVGETVGYQVRLQSVPPRPPGGAILYCTSGVLLKRLQNNPGLEGCTHVFIDEAHERDVNTDITLLLLRRALDINRHLKVIVMSATLDTGVFTRYFDDCPVIQVPGRTFPVEISHLPDIEKRFNIRLPSSLESCRKVGKPQINCQEIVQVIKSIDNTCPEGAILVFLPGWAEIKQTQQLLQDQFKDSPLHMILPVHSRLSTSEQTKIFSKCLGIRKIVLATNIAETSITIPDVVHVIDSGIHRENRLRDTTNISSLETVWASKASCTQRAGRAGRVKPGHCYKMYTKEKEEEFQAHTTAEILRVPLEQTVLDCKTYAPDDRVEDFLSQLPEPPSDKAVRFAVNDLVDLGALNHNQKLTRLGAILSRVSIHPRLCFSVLSAAFIGNIIAGVRTALVTEQEFFEDSGDRRNVIREIKRSYNKTSDYSALYHMMQEYEMSHDKEEFCTKYGLRRSSLNYIKALTNQYLQQILSTGVIEAAVDASDLNRFSDIDELASAALLSGSNKLLVTKKHMKTKGKLAAVYGLFTSKGERAHIASDSVNHGIIKKNTSQLLTYFGGHHSIERRALVVYKSTLVSPITVILFAMGDINKMEINNDVTELAIPRHKLKIEVPTSQVEAILKAREMLWKTFQYYIERDLKTSDFDDLTEISRFKIRLVKSIGRILVEANDASDKDCLNK
ncbi:ATP-dependent RNA helicase DHX30-like isoform X1 [Danaus plexippus]|uniref:ATP-dependent RNA helicase DHX30-like isoform X1 n=1 Tax=Danaus plexippus TaxID=13037 RepID=UPI002AB2F3AE|nr:ATP-dependent RNA helicase DHX30-like isoform X1 [Danaus plexippus]